jgi:hypothetical protein
VIERTYVRCYTANVVNTHSLLHPIMILSLITTTRLFTAWRSSGMKIQVGNTYVSRDGNYYAKVIKKYSGKFYKFTANLYEMSTKELDTVLLYSENGEYVPNAEFDYDLVALYQDSSIYWLEE